MFCFSSIKRPLVAGRKTTAKDANTFLAGYDGYVEKIKFESGAGIEPRPASITELVSTGSMGCNLTAFCRSRGVES